MAEHVRPSAASSRIEFFASFSSPYCYFALDRLDALARDTGVPVLLREVRPGIVRLPETFSGRSAMEQAYFERDIARTADFLGLPFALPAPYPVTTRPDTLYTAAADQPHIWRLHNALGLTADADQRLRLYAALMRRVWAGRAPTWHADEHLAPALAEAGLDPARWKSIPTDLLPASEGVLDDNERAFESAGHWGVPTFVFNGEPFYGQDRLDQLRWRVESRHSSSAGPR